MKSAVKKLINRAKGIPPEKSPPDRYFKAVYKHNFWKGEKSRSGTGSEGVFAEQKIGLLKEITSTYNISNILDLGCGDFYWMKDVTKYLDSYHGVDIVDSVIQSNRARYGSSEISFQCLDLSSKSDQELLKHNDYDLIVCFDIIGHMLNEEIDSLLQFIFNNLQARYLLLTNRIDEKSEWYLQRPKSRREGINIQRHPLFLKHQQQPIWKQKAEFPGDFFELYDLNATNQP